jgi:hypothetical protein
MQTINKPALDTFAIQVRDLLFNAVTEPQILAVLPPTSANLRCLAPTAQAAK